MAELAGLSEQTMKGFLRGTHRVVSPAETVARMQPFLRSMGITRIANVTGLDTLGIPTMLGIRPNSRSLSVSQGKGLDPDAAKASAIMEAVEHSCAENTHPPLVHGCYEELRGLFPLAEARRLPRYVRPFSDRARLLWAAGHDLFAGRTAYVPLDMVHLDLTLPLVTASGFFPLGSNGLASGKSLGEAIVHGLCELVERDAVALFRAMPFRSQQARRLVLDSVDDEAACELLERYRSAGVRVAVWDVTSDVGVAAFLCAIVEQKLDVVRRVGRATGFGCHPDRGIALCRALCEAAQSRLTRIAGSRDDIQQQDFDRLRSEQAIVDLQSELELTEAAGRSFRHVPCQSFQRFDQELSWILGRLSAVGVGQAIVVDLSQAPQPVSVVRVVVPGLEGAPDIPGYVPGPRAQAVHREHQT